MTSVTPGVPVVFAEKAMFACCAALVSGQSVGNPA